MDGGVKRCLVPRGCTVSTLSMTLYSQNPREQVYRSFILPNNPFPADTRLKGIRPPMTYFRRMAIVIAPRLTFGLSSHIRHPLLVADQKDGHKRPDLDPVIYRRIAASGAAFPGRVKGHLAHPDGQHGGLPNRLQLRFFLRWSVPFFEPRCIAHAFRFRLVLLSRRSHVRGCKWHGPR